MAIVLTTLMKWLNASKNMMNQNSLKRGNFNSPVLQKMNL